MLKDYQLAQGLHKFEPVGLRVNGNQNKQLVNQS